MTKDGWNLLTAVVGAFMFLIGSIIAGTYDSQGLDIMFLWAAIGMSWLAFYILGKLNTK